MKFENKKQIVDKLVSDWDMKEATFYNTPTNKQREKYWTYNRTLRYLFKLEREYFKTKYGITRKPSL